MAAKRVCAGTVGHPSNPNLGKPCRRWAVHGSDFCAVHGGSSKNLLANPSSLENRCTAKAHKTGEQCRNNAIRGGTVCRFHGGASGHVAKKARERLLEMVEPALAQLNQIMSKPATSDSDRLRAIQMVLDRTGYGPGRIVEVDVKPWEISLQRIVKEIPEGGLPIPTYSSEAIVDAELVEDDLEDAPEIYRGPMAEVIPMRIGSANPPRQPQRP